MKYIITSINDIEGTALGIFSRSSMQPFFQSAESNDNGKHFFWTALIGEAKHFDSESDAYEFVHNTWGYSMDNAIAVLAVQDAGIEYAEAHKTYNRNRLDRFNQDEKNETAKKLAVG